MENIFGCESIEGLNIPEKASDFFKPQEGNTKIRFLAGPLKYYESQEFDDETRKPVGEKKFYSITDEKVKTDKQAKLTLLYIIYDYSTESVKQWTINTKQLLKSIQALNGLNPDLSKMDCQLTKKKGSNGFMEYQLVSGTPTVFDNKEVIESFKKENPLEKAKDAIDELILKQNDAFDNEAEDKATVETATATFK